MTPRVVVPLALGGADRAWRFLLDLANDPHVPPWVLVGGLMVELHAYEHGVVPVRVTDDADVLVDLFTDPAGTERVAAALVDRYGLSFDTPGPDGVGHRFRDGDLVVDVLAPDRLGPRTTTRTVPPAHTVRVPAGRRLLRDAEPVVVSYDGHESVVGRPRLVAAIIRKARAGHWSRAGAAPRRPCAARRPGRRSGGRRRAADAGGARSDAIGVGAAARQPPVVAAASVACGRARGAAAAGSRRLTATAMRLVGALRSG